MNESGWDYGTSLAPQIFLPLFAVAVKQCSAVKLQPCDRQLTLYVRNIPNVVCVAPPEDEQVML
jgi:hypothetical protein